MLLMTEVRDGIPGGDMLVLDFYSRKQPRVTRSTFGAELTNQLEASELGMLHRGFWHQVCTGERGAKRLHELVNGGDIKTQLYMVGDAHAVFTAVTAEEISVPNDRSQLYAVRALRDRLECGSLSRLLRCDTRDMLCDALTKGSIARQAIVDAFAKGYWRMEVRDQSHAWPEGDRGARGVQTVALRS